jgi:hypothetical protein
MAILTNLPVTATCGTPVVVTVDKAQFVIDFGIVDAYWSDPANWQEIEFYYVNSANGLQVKKMSFAGNTYSLNLKTNIWDGTEECKKITLMDGNGATLAFARASFPVAAEFDFASVGGYNVTPFNWVLGTADIASNGGGELHRSGGGSSWNNSAWSTDPITGDFTFSGDYDAGDNLSDVMIGYHYPAVPQTDPTIVNTLTTGLYYHGIVTMATYGGSGVQDTTTSSFSGPFEIKRVGSLITGKHNGVQIFSEVYSGTVYISALMYNFGNASILNATLSVYNGPVVWSSAWKDSLLDLSNTDLTLTGNTAPDFSWGYLNSFQSVAGGGKYYFEMTLNDTFPNCYFGASYLNADPTDFSDAGYPLLGGTVDGVYIQLNADGNVYSNGSSIGLNGPSPVDGDVIMMAFDLAAKKLWFGKNGTWSYSGDPATNTGGVSIATQLTTQTRFQVGASLSLTGQVTIASTPLYTPAGFSVI